jgi:hypothetical protein
MMKRLDSLAVVTISLALSSTVAFAQQTPHERMGGMMMGEHHDMMMQMHQKMETAWKEQDAELDKLVAQMKSASGDQKVSAIEAVVSKLVELHKQEHENMIAMHEKWKGMMQRKMKGKTGASPSPNEHSEQHP